MLYRQRRSNVDCLCQSSATNIDSSWYRKQSEGCSQQGKKTYFPLELFEDKTLSSLDLKVTLVRLERLSTQEFDQSYP